MLKIMIASGTALGIAGTIYLTAPLGDEIDHKELARQAGISEPVYNCINDLLSNKTEDELIDIITEDIPNVNTDNETELVSAMEECVMQDPLGWYGTPNEEFIPLLGLED